MMDASARAAEEVNMDVTTSSTSSMVVATLGNSVLSNNETNDAMKFTPIFPFLNGLTNHKR